MRKGKEFLSIFHTFYYSYKTLHLSLQSKNHSPKKGESETAGVRTENKMKKQERCRDGYKTSAQNTKQHENFFHYKLCNDKKPVKDDLEESD